MERIQREAAALDAKYKEEKEKERQKALAEEGENLKLIANRNEVLASVSQRKSAAAKKENEASSSAQKATTRDSTTEESNLYAAITVRHNPNDDRPLPTLSKPQQQAFPPPEEDRPIPTVAKRMSNQNGDATMLLPKSPQGQALAPSMKPSVFQTKNSFILENKLRSVLGHLNQMQLEIDHSVATVPTLSSMNYFPTSWVYSPSRRVDLPLHR